MPERMHRYLVWRPGRFAGCWECDGGGNYDLWQVVAPGPAEALRLVKSHIRMESWDEPSELHALSVAPSRARIARVLRSSEWMVDQSAALDPPEPPWVDHE